MASDARISPTTAITMAPLGPFTKSFDPCQVAMRISQSNFLKFGILVKAVLCFLAVIVSIPFLKKKGIAWLGNPNSKVLYIYHLIWAVEVPLMFGIAYFYDGIRYLLPDTSSCPYAIEAPIGFAFRAPPGIGVSIQTMSMLSISIERAISTIFPGFFERRKVPWLGIGLTLTLTGSNVFFWVSRVVGNATWDTKVALTTVWLPGNIPSNTMNVWIYMNLEFVTCWIFVITFWRNKVLSRNMVKSNDSVNKKYQITENLRVMRALLPCFVTHFFFQVFQYGVIQVPQMEWLWPEGSMSKMVFTEIVAFQPYLYIAFFPLFLHFCLKRQYRQIDVGENVVDLHFEQINLYFDDHYERAAVRRRQAARALSLPPPSRWQKFKRHVSLVSARRHSPRVYT